ncbi:MAG TPA: hypothetical protein VIG24_06140 [Acidimicrobiia bacterium]
MAAYKVLVGLDYAGKRAEPGALVTDIPSRSVSWLLEQGLIAKAEESPKSKREPESPKKEA